MIQSAQAQLVTALNLLGFDPDVAQSHRAPPVDQGDDARLTDEEEEKLAEIIEGDRVSAEEKFAESLATQWHEQRAAATTLGHTF